MEHERDAIALAEPALAEGDGRAVLERRELAVRDALVVVADRRCAGSAGCARRVGESAREIECG